MRWQPDIVRWIGDPAFRRSFATAVGAVGGLTFALQVTYPLAVVASFERPGAVASVAAAFLGLAAARAVALFHAANVVRRGFYLAVARLVGGLPVVRRADDRPAGQIETDVARAGPALEDYYAAAAPAAIASALATTCIASYALARARHPGTTAIVLGGLALAATLGVVATRRAGRLADAAWRAYEPVADAISRALRARVEIRANGLETAHGRRLEDRAAAWAGAERRATMAHGLAGRTASVMAVAAAVLATALLGVDVAGGVGGGGRREMLAEVLLALSAFPALSAAGAAGASMAAVRRHVVALGGIVDETSAPPRPGPVDAGGTIGDIAVRGVEFAYGGAVPCGPVVVAADFVWRAGESLALVGPNGCGKTTATYLVLGLLDPGAGSVRVRVGERWEAPAVLRNRVAYLAQTPYFDDAETVLEAIRFVAGPASETGAMSILARMLGTGAEPYAHRRVGTLSAGQRRMVAIARTLAKGGDFLVLDEPEAGLDYDAVQRLADLLRQEARRRRMLLVTHRDDVSAVTDRTLTFAGQSIRDTASTPCPTRRDGEADSADITSSSPTVC